MNPLNERKEKTMSYIIVDSKNSGDDIREKMRDKMQQSGFRRMGGHRGGSYRGDFKEEKYEEGYKHGYEDALKEMKGEEGEMFQSGSRYGR